MVQSVPLCYLRFLLFKICVHLCPSAVSLLRISCSSSSFTIARLMATRSMLPSSRLTSRAGCPKCLSSGAEPTAIMRRLKFLFSLEGSINRKQFWIFFTSASAFSMLMITLAVIVHQPHSHEGRIPSAILLGVAMIVVWWTMIVIFTKRWHDLSRSGLWSLLWFIPLVGPAIVIAWLGFVPGQRRDRWRRRHSRTEAPGAAPIPEYRPLSKQTSEGS